MDIVFERKGHRCSVSLEVGNVYFDSEINRVEKYGMKFLEVKPVGNKGYVIISVTPEKTMMQRIEWGNKRINEIDEYKEYDTAELAQDLWDNKMGLAISLTYSMIYDETLKTKNIN